MEEVKKELTAAPELEKNTKTEPIRETVFEEKILHKWTASERAFQRKDKDFWITAVAILVLVSVIFFFIKEFFLIIALISALFLAYALLTVEPGKVNYKISNRGVYFGDLAYDWDSLERFWFKNSLSNRLMLLETKLRFPRQVSLVINPEDETKIKEISLKYIPYLEASPTFIDKLTKWLADKLPLENREK